MKQHSDLYKMKKITAFAKAIAVCNNTPIKEIRTAATVKKLLATTADIVDYTREKNEFMGITIVVDHTMPPDAYEFRDRNNNVVLSGSISVGHHVPIQSGEKFYNRMRGAIRDDEAGVERPFAKIDMRTPHEFLHELRPAYTCEKCGHVYEGNLALVAQARGCLYKGCPSNRKKMPDASKYREAVEILDKLILEVDSDPEISHRTTQRYLNSLNQIRTTLEPAVNGDALAKAGKATMTLNLSAKEMTVLDEMAKTKDMSKTSVMRQALRMYQMIDIKMTEGKRMVWLKPDGTQEETIPMMALDCTALTPNKD